MSFPTPTESKRHLWASPRTSRRPVSGTRFHGWGKEPTWQWPSRGVTDPERREAYIADWWAAIVLERLLSSQEENAKTVEVAVHPSDTWMENNWGVLSQYSGQHVAVHPTRGIVAHGEDLTAVYDQVKSSGLLGEVVFAIAPPA